MKGVSSMPRSEAQKRADKKYHDKKYRTFSVNAKVDEYEMIAKYCEKNGISKNALLLNSARYCIENNIDLKTKESE